MSDNQGVKEETLTQMGRRVRDRQPGREDSQARRRLAEQGTRFRVQINQGEQLGSKTDPQPRAPVGK